MDKPMIITLKLAEPGQQYFTDLRNTYFPQHLNYLKAHLTLFHALPASESTIEKVLELMSGQASFELQVTGLHNLGNGVAFKIESELLLQIHTYMQRHFQPWLVGKDKQTLWPHITIQNKVTAFKAQSLLELLEKSFEPFSIKAIGLSSFIYEGGPWTHVKDYPFN